MKNRQYVDKRRSGKKFGRIANKTHKRNTSSTTRRGGARV